MWDDRYEEPEITIRWQGNRYIIVRPDTPRSPNCARIYVFGIEQGGKTREEALFWAERVASKNGLQLILPAGWENVVAALPDKEIAA